MASNTSSPMRTAGGLDDADSGRMASRARIIISAGPMGDHAITARGGDFSPFYSARRAAKNLGLGLRVTQRIIGKHGRMISNRNRTFLGAVESTGFGHGDYHVATMPSQFDT